MADLVTRIIADDRQFNDKIERSKKTVKGWSDETSKAGQASAGFSKQLNALAGGGIAKLAGGFGLVATAGATFKKIIDSSQTSADKFDYAVEGAKTTVDQFFKSISMGDFTNFVNGLDDVYKRAKNARMELDQLWNTQLSFNIFGSEAQFQITSARARAKDRELSPEERRAAVKEWESAIEELRGYSETYKKDIESTTKSIIQTYNTLGSESFGMKDIKDVFSLDLQDPSKRDEIKGAIFEQYKEYTEAVKQAEKDATKTFTKTTQMAHGRSTTDRYKAVDQNEFQPALKALNEQYKKVILTQSLLEAADDKQLQDIADKLQEYSNVSRSIAQLDEQINIAKPRIESQIEKDLKGEGGLKVKTEILPAGSLAELEKQISDARKMLMDVTTTEGRASADALIKHLESQKAVVEVLFKYSDPGNIGSGNKFATADPLAPLKGAGTKLDMSNVVYSPELEMFDSWGERVGYVADQNRDLMDSIQGVSSIMANMGDVVGENASQWMQWGANVLSAVGQAIPSIAALTTAKKAEATANTASAASGAASSVASIPVVGPIMAIASIASILGALANLPKFALGGIVPGTSFSGDKVLARVNSGEMILNQSQQNKLLGIANGRGAGTGTGETITLRVKGKDLEAVLGQNQIMNRRI
jgi:uncharacterized protein (UPF0335 family)